MSAQAHSATHNTHDPETNNPPPHSTHLPSLPPVYTHLRLLFPSPSQSFPTSPPATMSVLRLAAVLTLLSCALIACCAQSAQFSFCFLASSEAYSPYGPWSVATTGVLTVNSTSFVVPAGVAPASAGGLRPAYTVLSATGMRTQLNRDGSTSTATLGLCPTGVQGSDNLLYTTQPWTDWNGFCLAVLTSSDRPFASATNWVLFANDFPVQQIELYYDLPTYNFPTEYHQDDQYNAVLTVQNYTGTAMSCTPAALTAALQISTLTYQFCYQAYAPAAGSVPAWQVAMSGAFVTQSALNASLYAGTQGLYVLSVTGQRTQVAGTNTTTVAIAGQAFVRSGGGDGTELSADTFLFGASPHLDTGGIILYAAAPFAFANGVVPLDSQAHRSTSERQERSVHERSLTECRYAGSSVRRLLCPREQHQPQAELEHG